MNYIGIDIGSTASKVAVKEIMIYICTADRMEQQRNLPDDQGSFTGRWYRCVNRTIRKLSQPDMAVLP